MIDVGGDAVGLRGEGDGGAGDVDDFAVIEREIAALRVFAASVWQKSYGEGEEEVEEEEEELGVKEPLPLSI